MIVEEQFQAMASAPMTSPQRLKGLMDAVTKHSRFATIGADLTVQFKAAETGSHISKLIADKLDDTFEAECLALEEVATWASALLSDGTLGHCHGFLINRDQFFQSVERAKLERARPKGRSKLTALWSRFFDGRLAAQAPSPNR